MAFLIGDGEAGNQPRATDNNDFLAKLVDFLTGVTGSIPVGERWTLLKDVSNLPAEREVYLRAPGLSASEQIFVNMRTSRVDATGVYYLEIRGAIGFDTLKTFITQPQVSLPCYLPLNNLDFDYWFVANGRRFVVVALIESTWQHGYGGLYLPFATPAEFPYPLFVGGSTHVTGLTYRDDRFYISGYWDSAGAAQIIHRDNSWLTLQNIDGSKPTRQVPGYNTAMHPYRILISDFSHNIDGSYSLIPCVMDTVSFGGNTYGELEGVYGISGHLQLAGSILTVSGVEYLVAANSNRLGRASFVAIRLQ